MSILFGWTTFPTTIGTAPDSISNLELWLKADAISGLNDGDGVTTWNDQSGNSRNFTQGTAANKPSYKTSILNGYPVVRFNGSSHHLLYEGTIHSASYVDWISIFVICNQTPGGGSTYQALLDVESDRRVCAYEVNGDYTGWYTTRPNAWAGSEAATTANQILVFGMDMTDVGYIRRNGAVLNSSMQCDGHRDYNTHALGSSNSGASWFYDGDIAEVCIYQGISSGDLSGLETNLANKYGITLS